MKAMQDSKVFINQHMIQKGTNSNKERKKGWKTKPIKLIGTSHSYIKLHKPLEAPEPPPTQLSRVSFWHDQWWFHVHFD